MNYLTEFKVNKDGELLGFGGAVIEGFSLAYDHECYFQDYLDDGNVSDAADMLDYITKEEI